MTVPAADEEIAVHIATLLNMYFVVDQRSELFTRVAKIWLNELDQYPEWAINAAVLWWVGRGNPHRSRKPLPGDISARADAEMAPIKVASQMVQFFEKYGDKPPAFLLEYQGDPK